MKRFPYSAPAPNTPPRLVSEAIVPGITWLIDNQREDGSWGGDSLLDRVIATCHSSMALLSAGFMLADPVLRGAVQFLTSDRITVHTWGFWRIAPLANSPADRYTVHDDLHTILDRVNRRSGSPHPDQLLDLFLMKVLIVLGRQADAARFAGPVLDDYSPENGWFGRADTTTHAIAVLAALDQAPANLPEMLTTADHVVRTRCVRHGPGLVSWGDRVTTTAYTVINVLESPLCERPALLDLAAQGARWISSQQQSDGSWSPETPPYGGEGEIVHPAYFTAVALRCILAYVDSTVGSIGGLVQASYVQARVAKLVAVETRYAVSNRRWRTATIAVTTATALTGISAAGYKFKEALQSNWSGVAGLAIVVIAAIIVLIFDLVHYSSSITRWIRSRLSGPRQ